MARRQPHKDYAQPPANLRPPEAVYEWKRVLRRVKARRGRPNSKTAHFHAGIAIALDRTEVVVTSAVKHVGTVMSDFADYEDGRNIIRPIEEIANGCDLDRATVMGAISVLISIGMLWRGYRGSSGGLENTCSEYQLVIADDLAQRVPLHPPTERNDQVTRTHQHVENSESDRGNQVTPTRGPGDSDSPGKVSRSHPSYPVTNPYPTQHANNCPATADVEGCGPGRQDGQIAVGNFPETGQQVTRLVSQGGIGRCRKCHRHEQRTRLDDDGHCGYCAPSRQVPA